MDKQLLITIVSSFASFLIAYVTAWIKAKSEIKKWELKQADKLRESNVNALSDVIVWMNQPQNLYQKNKAISSVSSALSWSSGEHAEILTAIISELSSDHPNERKIKTLSERYSKLKMRKR